MAFKVTGDHWDIIINYMELHPDLARGRINGPSGKDTFKKLWAELTLQLIKISPINIVTSLLALIKQMWIIISQGYVP
ncbi:hypothetical protein NQ317_019593 [Molorchus minor]|uniref:Regulatory protein zeste n=1 Tax=Molorchus minor TaxID=1323400 RepID=A0ABQ9J5S3_9CUCU|nr:hypothetical protein NQ317_019593 [Molorchus minor]